MKNKKKKGFTLVELMSVIAILGIFSTLIFSLFSSSTSMLVMAENDNVIQNESRNIIDVLEEDIRYGSKIKPRTSGTGNVLSLTRNGTRYVYKIEGTEFKKYKDNTPDNGIDNADDFIVAPSKNVKEFEISEKEGLYKIRFKFENGKSNYDYENSIYPMNGN
ncbi:prepilin-type N-terminal cleavage/methylation domain-containing protein [Clostridium thermobutyricum]|uniref:Prepilin-type N-terminal cleavage/methylation domain-containing protein n=1 Tax=Clostridium thermobutyricum TaxID=29372 RepID=N9XYG6_9CLOT|nr:type II secretion system protein [Clostridium thermobutyricum]ENZ00632.1 prepilin-type N-terminal cleavage/methylation domain-containing protein [Clostridium thermobutyricum]